jgi:hypothetical protein
MWQWISEHRALAWSVTGASAAIFIASLFIIPALIVRIEPDYYAHQQRPPSRWARSSAVVRMLVIIGRNLLGETLMIAGLAMHVLPGQGVLSSVVGFMLIDVPAKYRMEQWLLRRRMIHRPINWLRRRAGREPLKVWHNDAAPRPTATE